MPCQAAPTVAAPRRQPFRPAASRSPAPAAIAVAGALVSIIVVANAIAYPSLIFGGPLEGYLGIGVRMALLSAVIQSLALALGSSCRGAVGIGQSETAVVLGAIVAGLVAGLPPGTDPAPLMPAILAVIAAAALLLGLFLLLLGTLRLADWIRFIPYPVIGGFLAGIGWLLVMGAFKNALGAPLRPDTLPQLLGAPALLVWLPAALLAGLLFALQRRRPHVMNLPAVLLGAAAIFWLIAWQAGVSPAALRARGLLFGDAGGARAWLPFQQLGELPAVDWAAIAAAAPELASLLLIALITLLLTASSIELVARQDLDLNRELQVTGIANLISGIAGSLPGYHSLSGSTLAFQLGAPSRAVGVIAAAVAAAGFYAGPALLAVLPRFLVSLVLLFVALNLLSAWLVGTRRQLPGSEYAVLLAVFAGVGFVGIMAGVALGVALGIVLFVVSYSRISVVRQSGTTLTWRSNVERPEAMRELLRAHGEESLVLRLQGYVFFGTADRLLVRIRERLAVRALPPLRCLLIDFQRVSGLDSSALASFAKLLHYAEQWGFLIILTTLRPAVADLLRTAGIYDGRNPRIRVFADLDRGLEAAEDLILIAHDIRPGAFADPLERQLARVLPEADVQAFMRYVAPVRCGAGEALIRQGEPSRELYFIETGRVSVHFVTTDGRTFRLRSMGPGTVVGEVAFYRDLPRTASVVADADTTAWRLDRAALARLKAQEPALAATFHEFMAATMAGRMLDTNRLLEASVA